MTGFASRTGQAGGFQWVWEARSVNARGLDMRLRLPEGLEALEPWLRAEIARRLHRGNVAMTLRMQRPAASRFALDAEALGAAMTALREVEGAAHAAGVTLGPSTAADVLLIRGVLDGAAGDAAPDPDVLDAIKADAAAVLDALAEMRAAEGRALTEVIGGQIDRIATLTETAARLAEEGRAEIAEAFRRNLNRILEGAAEADPDRVAQELALLAVKADVTEEIDRLRAHVAAARDLLSAEGPVGRRLDFLTQEFNREANTLCSKAPTSALKTVGLDLKAVIDQMREQVQNVE